MSLNVNYTDIVSGVLQTPATWGSLYDSGANIVSIVDILAIENALHTLRTYGVFSTYEH